MNEQTWALCGWKLKKWKLWYLWKQFLGCLNIKGLLGACAGEKSYSAIRFLSSHPLCHLLYHLHALTSVMEADGQLAPSRWKQLFIFWKLSTAAPVASARSFLRMLRISVRFPCSCLLEVHSSELAPFSHHLLTLLTDQTSIVQPRTFLKIWQTFLKCKSRTFLFLSSSKGILWIL